MNPLFKTGDVVQLIRPYRGGLPYPDSNKPMIILDCEYWVISEAYCYTLLQGDIKIFLYERCIELV